MKPTYETLRHFFAATNNGWFVRYYVSNGRWDLAAQAADMARAAWLKVEWVIE